MTENREFDLLERRWLSERTSEGQEELLREIEEAELQYAIKYGIYRDRVTRSRTEAGLSKEKTRNRMRTRRLQHRCIGLPIRGRASKKIKKKRNPRCRIVVGSRQVIDWESFRQENANLSWPGLQRKWKMPPRVGRPIRSRHFRNEELSWSECVRRFGGYYGRAELHAWYVSLPRGSTCK